MTARGSSPTPSDDAIRAASAVPFTQFEPEIEAALRAGECVTMGSTRKTRRTILALLEAAYAVDLPSLRRDAAAQALEEAVKDLNAMAEEVPGLSRDQRIAIKGAALRLLARAQALREGR